MRALAFLSVVCAAACGSSSSECSDTSDCELGAHCVDGRCGFECTIDFDCRDPELRCDDRGRCIPIVIAGDADVDTDADTDADVDTDADTDTDTTLDPRFVNFAIGYSTPHPYGNDFTSGFDVIPPRTASQIALFVTGFQSESCCDHLRVYTAAGGSQLDDFSGSLADFTAGPYVAPTLYLEYDTDFSVTNYGFDIAQGAYLPR